MYCFSCMKNACPFPAWRGINQFRTIFGGALVCRSSSKLSRSPGDRPKNTTYWGISKQTCCLYCINPKASSPCQVSMRPAPPKPREVRFATDTLFLSPPPSPPSFIPGAFTGVSGAWCCCARRWGTGMNPACSWPPRTENQGRPPLAQITPMWEIERGAHCGWAQSLGEPVPWYKLEKKPSFL